MKSVIGALRVNLGLDSAAFEKGVARATNSVSGIQRSLENFAKSTADIGKRLSLVTGAMAAAGAAGLALAKSTATSAREIDKQAKISNASRQEFQRWAAGAKTVGIEQDKLSDILKDVNDRVGDFMQTGGGPMADFFENVAPKVGVTADQFARLSGPEALQLYVSSLQAAGLSQQDMTFYMEAMASDATALIPLLQDNGAAMSELGDQAERAGAVMSDQAIGSALAFQQGLDRLGLAMDGIRDRLGTAVMPLMIELIDVIEAKAVPAIQGFIGKVESLVEWFSDLPDPVKNAAAAITGIVAVAGPALVGLGLAISAAGVAIGALASPVALAVAGVSALAAGAAYAWSNWDELKASFPGITGAIETFGGAVKWLATEAFEQFKSAIGVVDSLLRGDFSGAIEHGKELFTRLGAAISGIAGVAVEAISGLAASFGDGLTDLAADAVAMARRVVDGIVDGLAGLYEAGVNAVKDLSAAIGEAMAKLAQDAVSWGKDVAGGLAMGLLTGGRSSRAAARELATKTDEDFKRMLGIQSPSKVFRQHGIDITEGLAIGIERGTANPVAAITSVAERVGSAALSAVDGLSNAFGQFVADGFRTFDGFVDNILNTFKSLIAQMIAIAAKNKILISLGLNMSATGGDVVQQAAGSLFGGGSGAGAAGAAGGGFLSNILGTWGGGASTGFLGGLGGVVTGLFEGGLGGAATSFGASMAGATSGVAGLAGAAGALAVPVLGLAAAFSFFKTKTKELDAGIKVTIGNYDKLAEEFSKDTAFGGVGKQLEDALKKVGGELDIGAIAETYSRVQKSKFWGLKKSTRTHDDPMFGEDADPILRTVGELIGGVTDMAGALGIGADAFKNFTSELKISTKGLSDEEAAQAVAEALGGFTDDLAAMIPGIQKYALENEGAATTLQRLTGSLATVNSTFGALGAPLYDIGLAGAGAAAALVEIAGGLENFSAVTGNYYDLFYSADEKMAHMTDRTREAFEELGYAMPATAEGFKTLVDGLLAGTAEDQAAALDLMALSSPLRQIYDDLAAKELQRTDMLATLANVEGNLSAVTGGLAGQFQAIGMVAPTTAAGLMDAVKAMDLTGDAAAALFQRLNSKLSAAIDTGAIKVEANTSTATTSALSPTVSRSYSSGSSAKTSAQQKADARKAERDRLRHQIWQLQGNTVKLRQAELNALDNSNKALQRQIWALEDARDAYNAISEDQYSTLAEFQMAQARAANQLLNPTKSDEEKAAAQEEKDARKETNDRLASLQLNFMKMLSIWKERQIVWRDQDVSAV